MKEGWLWLSILKTTASPSPMSTTPAFSPGPQITRGPVVGNVWSQIFDDLYEQCSLHITENIPSSVMFGAPEDRDYPLKLLDAQPEFGGKLRGDVALVRHRIPESSSPPATRRARTA